MVALAVEMVVLKMVSGIVMDVNYLSMTVNIMNVLKMDGQDRSYVTFRCAPNLLLRPVCAMLPAAFRVVLPAER